VLALFCVAVSLLPRAISSSTVVNVSSWFAFWCLKIFSLPRATAVAHVLAGNSFVLLGRSELCWSRRSCTWVAVKTRLLCRGVDREGWCGLPRNEENWQNGALFAKFSAQYPLKYAILKSKSQQFSRKSVDGHMAPSHTLSSRGWPGVTVLGPNISDPPLPAENYILSTLLMLDQKSRVASWISGQARLKARLKSVLATWCSGQFLINKVNQRWARLVLEWVAIFGRVNHLDSVCNQPTRSNSAFYPSGVGKMRTSFGWKSKAWFMPFTDKRVCVQVKLWKPLQSVPYLSAFEVGFRLSKRHYNKCQHLSLLQLNNEQDLKLVLRFRLFWANYVVGIHKNNCSTFVLKCDDK